METISVFVLASVAMGGLVWVFLYPFLSGERKAEQRVASVARAQPTAAERAMGTDVMEAQSVRRPRKMVKEREMPSGMGTASLRQADH